MTDVRSRLFKRGRPVDPHFQADEALFRRCEAREVRDGRLLPSAIKFTGWSVNRGKYSEPDDVLWPSWPDQGVARFYVRDLPNPFQSAQNEFSFGMEHRPEDENYPHSELHTFKNGVREERSSALPKTKKKELRAELSGLIFVVRAPRA